MPKPRKNMVLLADRLALLLVELVHRDMDYGPWCYDEFYDAGELRKSKEYGVCLDFVRGMVKRNIERQKDGS